MFMRKSTHKSKIQGAFELLTQARELIVEAKEQKERLMSEITKATHLVEQLLKDREYFQKRIKTLEDTIERMNQGASNAQK